MTPNSSVFFWVACLSKEHYWCFTFWGSMRVKLHIAYVISLGMPFQHPPRPENGACQGSSATEKYSRQLVLKGPSLCL